MPSLSRKQLRTLLADYWPQEKITDALADTYRESLSGIPDLVATAAIKALACEESRLPRANKVLEKAEEIYRSRRAAADREERSRRDDPPAHEGGRGPGYAALRDASWDWLPDWLQRAIERGRDPRGAITEDLCRSSEEEDSHARDRREATREATRKEALLREQIERLRRAKEVGE